ncbi:MAG: ATP-dependent DNA ligase [Bdellovibrionales bacterium]|nr:ATP-dependent DNA ligase [Oligoflexia bacterium]
MNFVALYRNLDNTNSTLEKTQAMKDFFLTANAKEAALGISLLLGNLPPKKLKTVQLTEIALSNAKIPRWLFEEAYASVGDLAETLSLIVGRSDSRPFTKNVSDWIDSMLTTPASALEAMQEVWRDYDSFSIMVLIKLTTGGLRIGVARGILIKAMAAAFVIPEANVAHSLTGRSTFDAAYIESLKNGGWKELAQDTDLATPYPFALASPVDGKIESLGDPSEWAIEWKWDGIRGQWIFRRGKMAIWSRGEELVTDRFPELHLNHVPYETLVLDGEILAWEPGGTSPLSFNYLQTRIGRKKITAASLKEAPIKFLAYDCLEIDGKDLRAESLINRRKILEEVIKSLNFQNAAFELSAEVSIHDWEQAKTLREEARARGVEGFILKRKTSAYFHGRKKGDWWKWKIDPMTLDAVLIYAQAGHGKRSNLFTDYTFALKDGEDKLVPVAKAYSGLTDKEIQELDRWIRAHTHERFGPVRSVDPEQVFELGFEGIAESGRHKSGIALRFPRILRWRKDKPVSEIDHVEEIRKLYLKHSELQR